MQNSNSLQYTAAPRIAAGPQETIVEVLDDDEGSEIPEHVIREAREMRERLRGGVIGSDFIPMHSPGKLGSHKARSADGRRTKDDSESDSEDPEDHVRMKFSEKPRKFNPSTHSKTLAGNEEEEEDRSNLGSNHLQAAILRSQAAFAVHNGSDQLQSGEAARMEAIENAAETAMGLLGQGLEKCSLTLLAAHSNVDLSSISLSTCNEMIERIKGELKEKGRRYIEFQRLRSYISDFVDCIADKLVIIEALEDSLHDWRAQMAGLREREESLWAQLLTQSEAAVSAILLALSMGKDEEHLQAAARASFASIPNGGNDEGVDEFGRSLALEKKVEAEVEKSLQQNAMESERTLSELLYHNDVHSLHDNDEGGATQLQSMRVEIVATSRTVFQDTSEEFSSLQSLKSALESFKRDFPHEYSSTYFPLSTAALFSPFVRLELLSWEPILTIKSPDLASRLEQQSWHQELFNYGFMDGSDSATDHDNDLVPQLVRKLALPLALEATELHWNPHSVEQCLRMADLYEDLLVYCEVDESKRLQDAIVQRIEKTISSTVVPLWPTAVIKHSKDAEIVQFRCFRQACLLVQSLGCFDGLLPQSWLRHLLLSRLLVQHCLPYLRAALSSTDEQKDPYQLATARLELVMSSLKPSWLLKETRPTELKPFFDHCDVLFSAAKRGRKMTSRLNAVAMRLES